MSPPVGRAAERPGAAGARPSGPSNAELLTSALTRLGYRVSEAERALAQLASRVETEPLQALLREALALLAK
jgi:Holliday junction resolvasome RuvABC DNA-binding subunit